MGKRVIPFSGRSEFVDWKLRNCRRCRLQWRDEKRYQCDIEAALDYAEIDNGTVRKSIGERMGFSCQHVAQDCPERELEEANVDSVE